VFDVGCSVFDVRRLPSEALEKEEQEGSRETPNSAEACKSLAFTHGEIPVRSGSVNRGEEEFQVPSFKFQVQIFQPLEARRDGVSKGWKSAKRRAEGRSQKSEVGGQRSEVGSLET
jgi:hypothetical protein